MEFILAGASAVQLGTVNFYDPTAAQRIVSEIPAALKLLNLDSVSSAIGLLAR
jgi:dihydroorotate dehydrogenase (NAD+) catalytic subunit